MNVEIILATIGGTIAAVSLFIGWHIHDAAHRTARDRQDLLHLLTRNNAVLRFRHDLEGIEFSQHMHERVWFGNPWRLYSVALLDFLMRHEFIDASTYNDACVYARARDAEMLDRITRVRKQVDDIVDSAADPRARVPGSTTPGYPFRD